MDNQMRNSSPPGGSREGSSEGGRGGDHDQRRGGRFGGRRLPRVCPFCKAKVESVDYKDADMLRRYLSERGKIKPRRKIFRKFSFSAAKAVINAATRATKAGLAFTKPWT